MLKIIADAIIKPDYLPQSSGTNINDVLNIVFIIFGSIAVLMVVYSGVQLILSQGNSEKVATARRSIIYSIAGLIVIMSSWAIVSFVISWIT